jgi:hypothetical protein
MFSKDELKQRASAARANIKDRSISLFKNDLKKDMLTTANSGKDSGTFFVNESKYDELIDLLKRLEEPRIHFTEWLIDHVKYQDEFEGITFKLKKLDALLEYSWE